MSQTSANPLDDATVVLRVTSSTGGQMARLLTTDDVVTHLTFPRLRLAWLRNGQGYRPGDYAKVGRDIGLGRIQVYEPHPDWSAVASYASSKKEDFFVVRPTVGADFHSHRDVIVHEATHAIQDRNRWRYSPLDAEVDAHFAQALYLVRRRADAGGVEPRLAGFLNAAREYDADEGYLGSLRFRRVLKDLEHAVFMDYQDRARRRAEAEGRDFDAEAHDKEFRKRSSSDGMTYEHAPTVAP